MTTQAIPTLRTLVQFPQWEIRWLDGRPIASPSMGYGGVEDWVATLIALEHDCRPDDVSFTDGRVS